MPRRSLPVHLSSTQVLAGRCIPHLYVARAIVMRSRDFASYACCGSHRFPQQRILFEAEPENILEVHTKQEGEQLLKSIFTCNKLKIEQFLPQLTAI